MNFQQTFDSYSPKQFDYVIVDTDVGGDDCQALICLFNYVKKTGKKLLGISCSNGNAIIDNVVTNVLITQAICGVSYPVYKGNDYSVIGENLKDNFFGEDGFGLRQSKYIEELGSQVDYGLVQQKKPYKFIAESAIQYKGKIALICLGPLSNIALAYYYRNEICDCFTNVSLMGTSHSLAGLHSFFAAEFNAGVDPEASYVVFKKFKDIMVIDFDTILGLPTEQISPLFQQTHTKKANLVREVYEYMGTKNPPAPPILCDPLSVISLFRPQVIASGSYQNVHIQIKGKRTRGASMIDYFGPDSQSHNVFLIKSLHVDIINQEIMDSYKEWA